ncbi:unnamed protein product [Cuscuta campestris]|uniref:RRM domain-containing protein n=1 Tax=Cuscuta campestris TaxID=132261 RepID=A0A484KMT2_9ASTE|nr:unnamed protein product [Cuscuta campestris]
MAGIGMHPYQQQWAPAPPPAAAPPPPPPHAHTLPPPMPFNDPNYPLTEEVRTVFISGLPEDVKERELQNLLRWLPGYEASQVNFKGEHPMGFALFSNHQFAIAAKDALQDMVFDAESKSVLHTEMAKKNLFVKRGIVTDANAYDQSKRMRTVGDYTHTGYSSPSPFHPPPPPAWGPPVYMAPPPQPYDPYGGYHVPPVPMHVPAPVHASPSSYVPVQNMKDNPPCNTLFIGNLGENIIEEEMRGLFTAQPGFKQMKILRQDRHTVCFIEFEDVQSATNVHQTLQGAVIPSSGSVGMRIQYPCPIYLPPCPNPKVLPILNSLLTFGIFVKNYCTHGGLTLLGSLWEYVCMWMAMVFLNYLATYSKNPFGKRKDFNNNAPAANGAPPMTY